jgi:DNA-binding transcriptional ArsR family regulator
MPHENADETYSVIYAALKHPVRRRVLRMLAEEDLTYTQILNKLDLDTGHLNYYLESLGELLAKTSEGKYRLSEFGMAAVELMAGVEETDHLRLQTGKSWLSKSRLLLLIQVLAVISLIIAALFFFNVKYNSEYYHGGTNRGTIFLAPNDTMANNDFISIHAFPTNTTTENYQVSYRILINTNATLWIQLVGGNTDGASHPSMDKLPSGGYLLYNQTNPGPYPSSEYGIKIGYFIEVPISPAELGYKYGNGGSPYEVRIANLGKATSPVVALADETMPNHTASIELKTQYPYIKEIDSPYYYHGVVFLVLTLITAVLPYLPLLVTKTAKKRCRNQKKI